MAASRDRSPEFRSQSPQPSNSSLTTSDSTSISSIRLQLLSLGLLRASEAVAWTSIFPYVYFMIKSFDGVEETQINYYAGLLIAIFTFCEFLSGIIWAKVSDRIGRRRTLLVGSVFGIITALLLGFSRSLALAVISRAFGGLLNPNVGVVQTSVVELVPQNERRAKALSLVASLRAMGNLIGPVLGGILADPVSLYPSAFAPNSFWGDYPYLLPNIAVVCLQSISLAMAWLFLTETRPQGNSPPDPGLKIGQVVLGHLKGKASPEESHDYALVDNDEQRGVSANDEDDDELSLGDVHELQKMPAEKRDFSAVDDLTPEPESHKAFPRQVVLQICAVSILAFHKVSSDAIMPTFLATPSNISNATSQGNSSTLQLDILQTPGGFDYGSQRIGLLLLSQAIIALIVQATLVPTFIGKFGPLRAYRTVLCIYPFVYLFTPFLPKLVHPISLILVALDLWDKVILSSVAYICSAILPLTFLHRQSLANATTERAFLARVNGASASVSCLARSVGPVVTGKLFSIGLSIGHIGIAFWTLSAVALCGLLESIFLKDGA